MRFVIFLATSTLVIAAEFTTSIGDTFPFLVAAMTTDAAGNTYIVGSRVLGSPNVVLNPNLNVALAGGSDVFVTKLDPSGRFLFTDNFGGKNLDTGTAIAVDPTGNIYIAGTTTSDDFPLSNALQTKPCSCTTGFIMKLSNDGATILYSTYFGGTLGTTSITSLATDAKGNLYVTGTTYASDFPHTAGMPFGQIQSTPSLIISRSDNRFDLSSWRQDPLFRRHLRNGFVRCPELRQQPRDQLLRGAHHRLRPGGRCGGERVRRRFARLGYVFRPSTYRQG